MERGDACLTPCPGPRAQLIQPQGKREPNRQLQVQMQSAPPLRQRPGLWGLHSPWENPIGQPHVWETPLFQLS